MHICKDPNVWDKWLSDLHGHPLQSSLWGEARRECDGFESIYVSNEEDAAPTFMARIETRQLAWGLKVAWLPKGPAYIEPSVANTEFPRLRAYLRDKGYSMLMASPYTVALEPAADKGVKTIIIDLTVPDTTRLANLAKVTRRMIRRAQDTGVVVEKTIKESDIECFFELCVATSSSKQFRLGYTKKLFLSLIRNPSLERAFTADLFVVRSGDKLAAGLFLIRSQHCCHNFWSAIDRQLSDQTTSPFLHWTAMSWARERGCSRYDFEGIDKKKNPGTYEFKKKFGGAEVTLEGLRREPLTGAGRLLDLAARLTGQG